MPYIILEPCSRELQCMSLSLHYTNPHPPLLLSRLLRITAHNLDLLRRHGILVIQLKVDVLNQERPYFVAEAVGVKMALKRSVIAPLPGTSS